MQVPFTQTKEYLSWQKSVGQETFYLETENAVVACVVLNLKVGKVLYCPFGPVLKEAATDEDIKNLVLELKKKGRELGCVFIRLENKENIFSLFSPPIKTYRMDGVFQPRVEWVLDLNKTQNEIQESFTKNCRYSIRRSEKEIESGNVKIEVVEKDFQNYFGEFVELMKETGERNNFLNHEEKYFESIFKSLDTGNLKSFLVVGKVKKEVSHDRDNLMDVGEETEWVVNAMAVIILDNENKRANYVYGGSRNFKRELGVSYKVQWEAIKKSIDLGCTLYNFGGITNGVFGKPSLQGVTNFKKQFGGSEQFNGYFYDLPIQKLKYFLYLLYKMVK